MTTETSPFDPDQATMTSVQEVLAADTGAAAPEHFRRSSPRSFGTAEISIDRYLSREHLRREYELLWGRVWQWAGNLEDIPEVGDQTVYDIGDRSVLLVRTGTGPGAGAVRAYVNACLHRGRMLRTEPGSSAQIRCGFHGWTWNLDGSLAQVPCRWDFPQVDTAGFRLPEVRCEVWAGFVFVNFDPDAAPLADSLDVIPEHFERFRMAEKFTAAWVWKVLPANWKITMEAFLESYHTLATHPQTLEFLADANTQYDIWDNASRLYTLTAAASPHLGEVEPEQVYEAAMTFFGAIGDGGEPPPLPAGVAPRTAIAELTRTMLREALGVDTSRDSIAEVIDGVQYWVFPNWCPWASIANALQYRFRPYGDDPDRSIFECRIMLPLPPGAARPPAARPQVLGPEDRFADAEGLLGFGPIFDQDEENLKALQRGLKATVKPGASFSEYHESRIRHFHHLLDSWLAEPTR